MNHEDLIDKYGIDNPPQLDNVIDKSIQKVEATMARATRLTGDTSWLFHPSCNEQMWEIANETIQSMHRLYGDFMAGVSDGSVFLYYPGQNDFRAYGSEIERFAYMLGYAGKHGCDIQLAPGACSKGTVFLPLERGQFIVVFEVCDACDAWAWEIAEMNFRAGIIAAQATLSPGAYIDALSPVAPAP